MLVVGTGHFYSDSGVYLEAIFTLFSDCPIPHHVRLVCYKYKWSILFVRVLPDFIHNVHRIIKCVTVRNIIYYNIGICWSIQRHFLPSTL